MAKNTIVISISYGGQYLHIFQVYIYFVDLSVLNTEMNFNEVHGHTLSSITRAVLLNDPYLLKTLINEKKISSNGHDNRGWFPIHHAAKSGSLQCLELLTQLEECNINWQSFEGNYTALTCFN